MFRLFLRTSAPNLANLFLFTTYVCFTFQILVNLTKLIILQNYYCYDGVKLIVSSQINETWCEVLFSDKINEKPQSRRRSKKMANAIRKQLNHLPLRKTFKRSLNISRMRRRFP